MANLGNTCFLNSITQCLLVSDSLASFAPPAIVNALATLRVTEGQTIRPVELVNAISQLSPSITSGEQQDAAEALEVMLASNIGQAPNPTQTLGEVTDVISCGTCGARALTTRPFYPPILRVPVTAPTLDLCLVDLLKPQPLSDRRCGQLINVFPPRVKFRPKSS